MPYATYHCPACGIDTLRRGWRFCIGQSEGIKVRSNPHPATRMVMNQVPADEANRIVGVPYVPSMVTLCEGRHPWNDSPD